MMPISTDIGKLAQMKMDSVIAKLSDSMIASLLLLLLMLMMKIRMKMRMRMMEKMRLNTLPVTAA